MNQVSSNISIDNSTFDEKNSSSAAPPDYQDPQPSTSGVKKSYLKKLSVIQQPRPIIPTNEDSMNSFIGIPNECISLQLSNCNVTIQMFGSTLDCNNQKQTGSGESKK